MPRTKADKPANETKPKLTPDERAQLARDNGKLGGRPPRYKSAEELETAIDLYFGRHNNKDSAPKWQLMLLELNISDDTLLNYRTKEEYINSGYSEVIKKAEQRHSEFWQQLALDHPNLQSFCMFQLKQPHNGGFRDRPADDLKPEVTITVKLDDA